MSEPNNTNNSSSYVLKLRINGEFRRVSLPSSPPPTLRSLERLLREIEPSLSHSHSALRVVWIDEDGDEIRVGSDYELREAIHAQTSGSGSGDGHTRTLRFSVSAEKVLSAPSWNASSAANNISSSAGFVPAVHTAPPAAPVAPVAPTAPTGSTVPWGCRSARSVPQRVSLFENIMHSVCGERPVSLSALRGERDRERAAEGLPFSSFAAGHATARAAEKRCAWAAQRAALKERERERERERLQAKREREREKTSKFVRAMDEHAAQVCASLTSFKREIQQAPAEPQSAPLTQQQLSHTEAKEKPAEQEKREEEREEERGWAAIVEVETVEAESESERDSPVLSNDNPINANSEQDKTQEKENVDSLENDEENEPYTELGSEDWNVISCSLPAYVQDVYSCAGSEFSEDMFEFDQEKEAGKEGESNKNNKSVPAVIMGSLNVNVHSVSPDSASPADVPSTPAPSSESVPVSDPEVPALPANEGEKDGETQALHAFARLWRKELEVLAEMGFDNRDLAAVAPLLREFIGSPSSLRGARAQIDQLGMDRLIAALLDL